MRTPQRPILLLGAAGLLATLAPARVAHAQCTGSYDECYGDPEPPPEDPTCWNAPTAADCRRPPGDWWWSSVCGQQELYYQANDPSYSTCYWYAQQEIQSHPVDRTIVPDELPGGGTVVDAHRAPYHEAIDSSATPSHYAGDLAQLRSGSGTSNGWWWTSPQIDRLYWNWSGAAVDSCRELVYEHYQSYSVVEDAFTRRPDGSDVLPDPLQAYLTAVRWPDGLLFADVVSKSGATRRPFPWPSDTFAKNAFFSVAFAYPKNTTPYPVPQDLVAKLDAGRALVRHDAMFHVSQGSDAALYPRGEFELREAKQAAFQRLLDQRASTYLRWTNYNYALIDAQASCDAATVPGGRKLVDPSELYLHDPVLFSGAIAPDLGAVMLNAYSWTPVVGANLGLALIPDGVSIDTSMYLDTGLVEIKIDSAPVMPGSPLFGSDGLPIAKPGGFCDESRIAELNANADEARQAVAAKLAEIDVEIVAALRDAETLGCLETESKNLCDWSPGLFVREVQQKMLHEREELFRECIEHTGGGFWAADALIRKGRQQVPNRQFTRDSYTGSSEHAIEFFAHREQFLAGLPRDPVTGNIVLRSVAADHLREWGDYFGVDLGYDIGWSLGDFQGATIGQKACSADFEAHANITLDAKVLWWQGQIFAANAALATKEDGTARKLNAVLKARLMGAEIAILDQDLDAFRVVAGPSWSVGQPYEQYIPAGPIMVALAAGASGTVGLDVAAGASLTTACPSVTTKVKGSITPYAKLDVFASAKAGIVIANVGAQANLTLARVDLPLTLDLSLTGTPSPSDPTNQDAATYLLEVKPKLSTRLTLLSGSVEVFLEVFWQKLSYPIVKWPGVVTEKTLFEPNWSFPLNALQGTGAF